jgi:hypothetical protein
VQGWRTYLKECSDHAQRVHIIGYIAIGISVFGLSESVLPLTDVDLSWLSKVPRLPLPWALAIYLGGMVVVVVWGGYKRSIEERQKHHKETEELKDRLEDVPRLVLGQDGLHADIRPLTARAGNTHILLANLSCLHVSFKNDPLKTTPHSMARDILAEIRFFDEKTGAFLLEVQGRWEDTTEPQLAAGQTAAEDLSGVDFKIGQTRKLDIAFKYQNESECFATSNEVYAVHNWKLPKNKILSPLVEARIRLRGVGVDSAWGLVFENPQNGELKPVTPRSR